MNPDERVLLLRIAAAIVAAAIFLGNLRTVQIQLGVFELPIPLSVLVVLAMVAGGVLALRFRVLMARRLGANGSRRGADPEVPRRHASVPASRTGAPAARSDHHASWLEQRRSPFD